MSINFPLKHAGGTEIQGQDHNRRTRNRIVADYFSNIQGGILDHLISSYTPYEFLGKVLVEFLEDPTPIDLLVDGNRMKMPPNLPKTEN